MRATEDPNWVPGDPLWVDGIAKPTAGYEYVRGGYANYLYNWRNDSVGAEPGTDAASWPTACHGRGLDPADDEIGNLIRLVRMDRAAREGDAA